MQSPFEILLDSYINLYTLTKHVVHVFIHSRRAWHWAWIITSPVFLSLYGVLFTLDSLPSSTSIYLHSLLLVHHEYRPLLITAGTTCPPQSLPTRPAAELLELYSVAIQLQFTARMDSHAIRDRDSGMFGEAHILRDFVWLI